MRGLSASDFVLRCKSWEIIAREVVMGRPVSLTINVEVKTSEHLKKLLELALFELDGIYAKNWFKNEGYTIRLRMSGDMGYTL